jgi:hypothetical protein
LKKKEVFMRVLCLIFLLSNLYTSTAYADVAPIDTSEDPETEDTAKAEDEEEASGCSSASGLDLGLALLPALGLSLLSISRRRELSAE